jgi:hypothetical protein
MAYYQNTSLECTSSSSRHLINAPQRQRNDHWLHLQRRLSQFKNGVTALSAGLTIDLVLLFAPTYFGHGIFL